MNDFLIILFSLSSLCTFVFLVIGICKLKDKPLAKKFFKNAGIALVATFVLLILAAITLPDENEGLENQQASIEAENSSDDEASIQDEDNQTQDEENELPIIYAENEGINAYLNAYNEANPEDIITSEMAKPYHHHGTDHTDQVRYVTDDGFEVVITSGSKVYIGYMPNRPHTNDEYKEMYIKYVKGFNLGLSDEEIEADWNSIFEGYSKFPEFDSYKVDMCPEFSDNLSYFTISRK